MYSGSQRKISKKTTNSFIHLNRVSRFFKPDKPALFDISLNIPQGEFLYIAGASGAGKSTLLKLLHLSEMPDTGTVLFGGQNVADLKRSAISVLRRSMGVIFQDFRLIDDLSVSANIGLPLEVAGLSRSAISKHVDEVVEKVGLPDCKNDLAGGLSGGEQQRVAIARALVGNPKLILADEPTGSLDTYSANYVLEMLETVNEAGATVIVATHDRLLMAARPHRTIALEGGRLVGISSEGAFKTRNEKRKNISNMDKV